MDSTKHYRLWVDRYLKEFLLILDEAAKAQGLMSLLARRGFARERSRLLTSESSNGLLFYLHADTGVYNPLVIQLPIQFWIGFEKSEK